jgi:hypothetical protein
MNDVLSKIVNILNYHMNIGQTNVINTDAISMITQKMIINNLNSLVISQSDGAEIILPALPYCSLIFAGQSCTINSPITINVRLLFLFIQIFNLFLF